MTSRFHAIHFICLILYAFSLTKSASAEIKNTTDHVEIKKKNKASNSRPSLISNLEAQTMIEKAQNLSLQKQRMQALELLLSIQNKDEKINLSIKESIEKISFMFFSDKTQQEFEMYRTYWKTDPNVALNKLDVASKTEPDNLTILSAQAVNYLSKNECQKASITISRYNDFFEKIEALKLLGLQIKFCNKQEFDDLSLAQIELIEPNYQNQYLELYLDKMASKPNLDEVERIKFNEFLTKMKKSMPNNPELYYWQTKIKEHPKSLSSFDKYVQACKKIQTSTQFQYLKSPWFCLKTAEQFK